MVPQNFFSSLLGWGASFFTGNNDYEYCDTWTMEFACDPTPPPDVCLYSNKFLYKQLMYKIWPMLTIDLYNQVSAMVKWKVTIKSDFFENNL